MTLLRWNLSDSVRWFQYVASGDMVVDLLVLVEIEQIEQMLEVLVSTAMESSSGLRHGGHARARARSATGSVGFALRSVERGRSAKF